jgi:hypothetical protein
MGAINGGPRSYLITPELIDSINVDTNGLTFYSVSTDQNGGAVITVDMPSNLSNGCNSNNGVSVLIGNFVPWTRMHCTYTNTLGIASCWGWGGNNGYGAGLSTPTGNMLAYNATAGDFTYDEVNVWNLSQFNKYFSACDNNSTNYMHGSYAIGGATGPPRGFSMFSRRNNMSLPAGPAHGRTCSGYGRLVISNMKVVI